MVHYSKKDWWLVTLVLAATLIPLLIGVYNLLSSNGDRQLGLSLLVIAVTTGAVVLLLHAAELIGECRFSFFCRPGNEP